MLQIKANAPDLRLKQRRIFIGGFCGLFWVMPQTTDKQILIIHEFYLYFMYV